MKKVLFATTALMLTGGMAMAEVTIGGNARFGLLYQETDRDTDTETTISYRLRFNIDASKETDSGVTFGGRIRMQYNSSDSDAIDLLVTDGATGAVVRDGDGDFVFAQGGTAGAGLNAAKIYASFEGMTVEVGNVDTAYDSAALLYNSELGYLDRSFGDPQGFYYSYSSSPYDLAEQDRVGIAFTYSVGDFNGRISWVTPNQFGDTLDSTCDGTLETVDFGDGRGPLDNVCTGDDTFGQLVEDDRADEFGLSADYAFDAFTISGAYTQDGNGISGNDLGFIGVEYAVGDVGGVGLLWIDNGDVAPDDDDFGDLGQQWTLYGNYKFDAWIVKGYIAYNNELGDAAGDDGQDTVYGIGADYDLGGATLSGSVQQGYSGNTTADIGVRFSF
jgi:outer membrane protein OmpU